MNLRTLPRAVATLQPRNLKPRSTMLTLICVADIRRRVSSSERNHNVNQGCFNEPCGLLFFVRFRDRVLDNRHPLHVPLNAVAEA